MEHHCYSQLFSGFFSILHHFLHLLHGIGDDADLHVLDADSTMRTLAPWNVLLLQWMLCGEDIGVA